MIASRAYFQHLLAKEVPFQFNDECHKAFDTLKRHSSQLQSYNPHIGSSRSRSCVMLLIMRWGPYLDKQNTKSITRSCTPARHLQELSSTMPLRKSKPGSENLGAQGERLELGPLKNSDNNNNDNNYTKFFQ